MGPDRDWRDAVAWHEGAGCLVCASPHRQLAHVLGRKYDEPKGGGKRLYVEPLAVVPLCPAMVAGHHEAYDAHALNLLPHLPWEHVEWAIRRVGRGNALRRIMGREFLTNPEGG